MARVWRKARFFSILVIVLGVLGGAALWTVRAYTRNSHKIDPERLVKVERIDLARSVVATGKVEPVTKVEVKSKASGIIQSLPVNVGDIVRKGQVICELDKNDLQPRLREAQAAVAVAEAAVRSAKAELERYQVEAAGPDVPFLKRDMERGRKMWQEGLIGQNARDETEKNYELGLNRQRSAIANLNVARSAITRAEAMLEQTRAAQSRAEEDLRNATILSPLDGVVLSRDREVGDAVSSILTMGAGATLIMTLGDLGEVYVKGKVDESDLGRIYVGQPARIKVESFKDERFQGRVTKISPQGVEKDNVTTFEVRVSISNESGKLRSGMTANAEIVLEEKKGVLAIPESAILYKKDKSTEVEIVDPATESGKRKIPVTAGISNGAKTEIAKGLSEGQQVILP
ncbi:MAG: efflux RND transporter periplasmic adaptor subunit [Bryobacterales bacterium]|nr:efflux RND transporter periplasmic adaptor subunit [Bryobacterales bacterium]